jgi:hypothetical protein
MHGQDHAEASGLDDDPGLFGEFAGGSFGDVLAVFVMT